MDDPQAVLERFSNKLRALRRAYLQTPTIFDEGGGFIMGPPLSEEQIQWVEREFGLVLPPEYRAFLRRFGDTPAGPGRTFFRMTEGLTSDSCEPFPLARPFLGCESPDHQRLSEDERRDDFLHLSRQWEQIPSCHGILKICDYGCAMYGVLILNGMFCGRVWFVCGDAAYYGSFGGSEPLHDEEAGYTEPTDTPKDYTFFEWYESWFDGMLKRIRVE